MGFGAYGKMPGLGDFFRIGLRSEQVAAWDGWVQAMLPEVQALLGPQYLARYMSAPVWRFALPPGVAGANGALGVMMPSVDRVGRAFPLLLMADLDPGAGVPLRALFAHGAVLDAAEALVLDCLDDAMTREALVGRLAALPLYPVAAPGRMEQVGRAVRVQSTVPALLCADLGLDPRRFAHTCAFVAQVGGMAQAVLCDGLPRGAAAVALFDPGCGDQGQIDQREGVV